MSAPLQAILLSTSCVANQNLTSTIICPQCGERHLVIKWGSYRRYLFDGDDRVPIQRFRCLNRQCSRCTFSVLPHPFLPVVRVPLSFFLAILSSHQKGCSVAQLARNAVKSWAMIRRCLSMASRVETFLQKEVAAIVGRGSPCLQPSAVWTVFTHCFSWAFFPNRF